MWIPAQLLLLAINAVNSQILINNLIQSTVIPPGETTRKDRMDTIYDEPVGFFTDIKEKLTPQDIEEFFDRDRRRKWTSSKKPMNPNSSWRSSTQEPTIMYKTDAAVYKNDPIEMEFQQMPARAKVFQEDSGLPLVTTRPIIRPISTETEITMSMSTLSDQSAPEMAEHNLDLTALSPLPRIMNDGESTLKPAVTIRHSKPDDLKQLALESAVDMAVIPRLHNDVQKLIEEVSLLKQLVSKLLDMHAREKKKEKIGKRKRNSRKVTGTSVVAPAGNRLIATQTQDHASTDHFVHIYKDGQRSRSIV